MSEYGGFSESSPSPQVVNSFHNNDDCDTSPFAHHHTLGKSPNQAAAGNHTHPNSGGGGGETDLSDYALTTFVVDNYAPIGHSHPGVYSLVVHNHDGVYSLAGHNHAGVYSLTSHNHDLSYSAIGHGHAGVYSLVAHTHADVYAPVSHGHAQADITNLVSDLGLKAPLASPAFTGTPTGITKAHVGLGNVDNTTDAAKPISTAAAAALLLKSDTSHTHKPTEVYNASVVNQTGFAADTYLVGSEIAIPAASLKAKSQYRLKFNVVKTGAGVATPIINVRVGTLGTTGDASRGTLTFSAQTAVIDEGTFEVVSTFRTVGAGSAAVLATLGGINHRLAATGLSVSNGESEVAVSAGFDSTVANLIIGVSVNGGASAAWTVTVVQAELVNII